MLNVFLRLRFCFVNYSNAYHGNVNEASFEIKFEIQLAEAWAKAET